MVGNDGDSTPADKTSGPGAFHDPLRRFLASMETARDIEQFIRENQSEIFGVEAVFARIASRLMPSANIAQHHQAAKIVHDLVHERSAAIREIDETSPEKRREIMGEYSEKISAAVTELTGNKEDNYHYATVWRRTAEQPFAGPILRASLLMGAVSDFEVLISAIVRQQLAVRPEILRTNEQKYTLQDLEVFQSLEDFRAHVAERMADALLRGGFEEWMAWFNKRHRIVAPGVTDCPTELVEVFQRRHLLVHNGGLVNEYYLGKLPDLSKPPAIGDRLRVGSNYLQDAIDLLAVAGIKLAFATARKMHSDAASLRSVDSLISNIAYDLLREGRYNVVNEVTDWHLEFVTNESVRLVSLVNRWLARKKLHGLTTIREEVEGWDTSTLAGRYKLVRLALLDMDADAHQLAQRLLAGQELREPEWHTWPVLENVRSYAAANDGLSGEDLYEDTHVDLPDPALDASAAASDEARTDPVPAEGVHASDLIPQEGRPVSPEGKPPLT